MNRRHFLSLSIAASATGLLAQARKGAPAPAGGDIDDLVQALIRANDQSIPGLLARQEKAPGHRWSGGIPDAHGIHTVGGTAGLVSSLACAVSSPGGKYFQSTELAEPLQQAVRYLLVAQHDDGTVDLHTTNFHSTPDAAFIVELLGPALLLLRASPVPAVAPAARDLERFMTRAGESLATGGVHTPNHRWVVCSALAWVHSFAADPRFVARVDQWLAESVDLDPDGQYTEKSTSVYSPIVDRALITVARLLDRPALLEPVRRNLEMTLYYVHPDGEVVTEASRRQDRYQRGSMARYYHSYRHLALHDGNGRFAAMARQIERTAREQLASELPTFLSDPGFRQALPPGAPLPTDYAKVFSHSNLARIRRGTASGTILADNTTLFSFRRGAAALEAVRLASAFFGKGQFTGETLAVHDGRYRLRQALEGPYYQPLTAAQVADGEHVRMAPNGTLAPTSRAMRTRSNLQRLETMVEVTESAGAFTLAISVTGTDRVPVAVELAFRHGGRLEGPESLADVKDGHLLRAGTGRYVLGSDTIEFGPGQAEHTYTQLRGALPKWDGQCVYLTGFTPFQATLRIS